jgi:hypothetical protein
MDQELNSEGNCARLTISDKNTSLNCLIYCSKQRYFQFAIGRIGWGHSIEYCNVAFKLCHILCELKKTFSYSQSRQYIRY